MNLQAIEKRLDRIEQALMKILLVLDQLEGDDPPDSQVSTLDGHQIDLPDGTSSLD